MAIGFTAELSHYPSGGRYATQAGIAAAAGLPPSAALRARQVRLPISQEVQEVTVPTVTPDFSFHLGPPGIHCSQCGVGDTGGCFKHCVWCPSGVLPDGCSQFELPCPPSGCCPPGQDACYDPYRPAKFCCPPGTSCCDPDNHLCCPSGSYCCFTASGAGECCSGDQVCTNQGCSSPQDLLCGGQDCTVVLPPGSNPACCNNTCTDTNTDINNCGGCGHVCTAPDGGGPTCTGGVCDFVCNEFGLTKSGTQCYCAITKGQVLTAPGSNNNYLLTNVPPNQAPFDCQPIAGLKVSFAVTKPLVAAVTASGPPLRGPVTQNGGFTFQLNAYNPAGPSTDWMQYVFLINNKAISYQVQYWDMAAACACCATSPASCTNGCACTGPLVALEDTVLSLPSNTIPAGYVLEIDLQNDVNTRTVTGALFSVTDNNKKTTSSLATLDKDHQFPIVAFEANVGGPDDGKYSQFTPGLGQIGQITYQVPYWDDVVPVLCAEGGLPDVACGAPWGGGTAETSNVTYSTIGYPCCASQITQSVNT
jgi:hypothetical protein